MKFYLSFIAGTVDGTPQPLDVWPYRPKRQLPEGVKLLCIEIPDDAVSKLFDVQTVQGQVNSQEKQDGR